MEQISFWNSSTTKKKKKNLDYLLNQTFRKTNRSFVLALKNVHHDSIRDIFDEYLMPVIEIKDFKVLIGNKTLFDQPVKNKPKAYENLSK